jgi:nicotinamidase-related amidase
MKSSYLEIITGVQHDLLTVANQEGLTSAITDASSSLLVIIDAQNDFIPGGSLAVPGADQDMDRLSKWIYDNMSKLTRTALSLDTHIPFQIFHPCWWIDKNGKNPSPFTAITLADLDNGKWAPVLKPKESREYVQGLEKTGKKVLVVWPFHCLQGTNGAALSSKISNMIYYHCVARNTVPYRLVKGNDPLTEMYGIIKAEFDPKNFINLPFVSMLEKYDKVIIAGEAKSHCVLESIAQILDFYKNRPEVTKKIYILDDCMSSIPGCEDATEKAFDGFKKNFQINIVKSTEYAL